MPTRASVLAEASSLGLKALSSVHMEAIKRAIIIAKKDGKDKAQEYITQIKKNKKEGAEKYKAENKPRIEAIRAEEAAVGIPRFNVREGPLVPEIKAELKALGYKNFSHKSKENLMKMLQVARAAAKEGPEVKAAKIKALTAANEAAKKAGFPKKAEAAPAPPPPAPKAAPAPAAALAPAAKKAQTVEQIKAELKALKVKGITGKTKAQLLEMLQKAKGGAAPAAAPAAAAAAPEKAPERIVMKLKKKVKAAPAPPPPAPKAAPPAPKAAPPAPKAAPPAPKATPPAPKAEPEEERSFKDEHLADVLNFTKNAIAMVNMGKDRVTIEDFINDKLLPAIETYGFFVGDVDAEKIRKQSLGKIGNAFREYKANNRQTAPAAAGGGGSMSMRGEKMVVKKVAPAPEKASGSDFDEYEVMLEKADKETYDNMFDRYYKFNNDKLSSSLQSTINKKYRPQGMISGEVMINDRIGIDFEPNQRFGIFARNRAKPLMK
jgi:hypothetical protein